MSDGKRCTERLKGCGRCRLHAGHDGQHQYMSSQDWHRAKRGKELSIARALEPFPAECEARLCAFLATMEGARQTGDVIAWQIMRSPDGASVGVVTAIDREEIRGDGATFTEAIKAFADGMMNAGMKGAPEA